MARRWQKVAALGRRISSLRANSASNFDACSTSSVTVKGHFVVYSSEGIRFMVPLAYLDGEIFRELLRMSEEEFGLPSSGPITLPCDAPSVEDTLSLLRRQVSRDKEKALRNSIFISSRSACSLFDIAGTQQQEVRSF